MVGSAQWNIVLKDVDGFFDLDFQLLLTKNSQKIKNFNYNKEKKNEATMIKEDFFNYMNKKYNDRERYKVENSTTSITFINKKSKYSIDFVLIKTFPDNNMIIRRSNSLDNPTKNSYVWNKLSNNNIAYALFNNLSPKEKEDLSKIANEIDVTMPNIIINNETFGFNKAKVQIETSNKRNTTKNDGFEQKQKDENYSIIEKTRNLIIELRKKMKNDNKKEEIVEPIKKPRKKDNNDSMDENINDEATTVHTALEVQNK